MGINKAALFHRSAMEYRYFFDSKLYLRLRTAKDDVEKVSVLYGARYLPLNDYPQKEIAMEKVSSDGINDWWEAAFLPEEPRVQYEFKLTKGDETIYYYETGISSQLEKNPSGTTNLNGFVHPDILSCDEFDLPDWARGAVIYQIFPDRFNRVGPLEEGIAPWGTPPDRQLFTGGNLKGMLEKVPYFKSLGVDVVYMTPIFEAGTNHRYDTIDYMKIDPMLGTMEDFVALADALHENGMRIMLDGVFNHSSTKFPPFVDLLEKGEGSEYADWYFPHEFPITVEKANYDSFSHGGGMPKLNMENQQAREYFIKVCKYWIEEGHIDGWRLDVANEIDKNFLRKMREEVKRVKPDVLIIGEVWTDSGEWLQGDMFDGVMHYQMTFPIREFMLKDSAMTLKRFSDRIQRAAMLYQHGSAQVSWVMLDSHDTSRMRTMAGSEKRFKAAAFLQFTLPGAPFVYYGDEIGLEGGDDPDCRRCMPWERVETSALLPYFQKLIALKHLPALQRGLLRVQKCEDGVFVFKMVHERGDALVFLNVSDVIKTFEGDAVQNLSFEPEREFMQNIDWTKRWELKPFEGAVFLTKERKPQSKQLKARDFRQMLVDLSKYYRRRAQADTQ